MGVVILKSLLIYRNDSQRGEEPEKKFPFLTYFVGIPIVIAFFTATLSLMTMAMVWGGVYACANFCLNLRPDTIVAFIGEDLTRGSFSLRIVSFTVPLTIFFTARGLWSAKVKSDSPDAQRKKKLGNRRMQILLEGLLFVAAASCLWYRLVQSGELATVGILLSFVLLFVIDDWMVLSYYRIQLEDGIPWTHNLRMFLAVFIVSILTGTMLFLVFSIPIALLLIFVVAPVLLLTVVGAKSSLDSSRSQDISDAAIASDPEREPESN